MKKPRILLKYLIAIIFLPSVFIFINSYFLKIKKVDDSKALMLNIAIIIFGLILLFYILKKEQNNIKMIEKQTNQDIWKPNIMIHWLISILLICIVLILVLLTWLKYLTKISSNISGLLILASLLFHLFVLFGLYETEKKLKDLYAYDK